jgi:hypothetical protein
VAAQRKVSRDQAIVGHGSTVPGSVLLREQALELECLIASKGAASASWKEAMEYDWCAFRGFHPSLNLIGGADGRRITLCACEALDVTARVNGLTVFIGRQIRLQAYGLAAKLAAYSLDGAAIHKRLLSGSTPA